LWEGVWTRGLDRLLIPIGCRMRGLER
jgi:hypothetical protein